jgi:hypothetical protein
MSTISVKITSERLLQSMFDIAKENGVKVCANYEEEKTRWKYFVFNLFENKVSGFMDSIGESVSIDEMVDSLTESKLNQLKLNENYLAVINRETSIVTVGCQNFSFEVINKLAELIKK